MEPNSNTSNFERAGRGRSSFSGRGRGTRGNIKGRGNWRYSRRGSRGKNQTDAITSLRSQEKITLRQTSLDESCPYLCWNLYFPKDSYAESTERVKLVESFLSYFTSDECLLMKKEEFVTAVVVDFKSLAADVDDKIPNFQFAIKNNPEQILNAAGLAAHHVQLQRLKKLGRNLEIFLDRKVHCRLSNYLPVLAMKNLRANYYGKLVTIRGTVVRTSNIKPYCIKMAFKCLTCQSVDVIDFVDGKFNSPSTCSLDGCRSRQFVALRTHPMSKVVDWQVIRVQEVSSEEKYEAGRIPRSFDCDLLEDLVDSCIPGDHLIVTGIVKVKSSDEKHKDKSMFMMYIFANYIVNSKGMHSGKVTVEFTLKELYAIEEIHEDCNLFRLIVASVCPTIYGHEMVKAGLVLGVFGGTQRSQEEKNLIAVRGDPHVLVIGDPGIGKSQMLQAIANVAPRSVYVCGNTTTTTGLTVTLSKESGSGEFSMEAGALVLADQGCCCIDEFDKMGQQHFALLEAMEQQSVSIAKAGIVANLPARTSILAAANPVGGHYNKSKTVSENLRISSPLLSRFDLVFILLDKPNQMLDSILSEHVMSLHSGKKLKRKYMRGAAHLNSSCSSLNSSFSSVDEAPPLAERLKVQPNTLELIPSFMLKKYISYARRYVHPKLGQGAAAVIQEFYLNLRKDYASKDSTPITTRQLESLIRLTEARAKIELREEATREDALDVVEIMKYSIFDTQGDESGSLDFQRSQNGSGMSSKSKGKRFIAILDDIARKAQKNVFTMQDMRKIADERNIQVPNFEDFIHSLNVQGFLLKKGPRKFMLQTTEY